ncbi:MAG: nucleotidyl transferase AbiEii/AbiGii toxin family protein [archaeon]
MEIPLILKLKKQSHKNIAGAQDLIIEEIYKVFDRAVLHGGTAIWRCYSGNRFSEDIDVYIPRNVGKINSLFENLEQKGFTIQKKKIGENSLYSVLKINDAIVSFEALFKKISGELREYLRVDGNIIMIYTLSPEELIKEKIDTYIKRQKIKDFYDIFFLIRHIKDKNKIKESLNKLIDYQKEPLDEKELRVLIIEGLIPDFRQMEDYIKRSI